MIPIIRNIPIKVSTRIAPVDFVSACLSNQASVCTHDIVNPT
jgi:hypothetical protein